MYKSANKFLYRKTSGCTHGKLLAWAAVGRCSTREEELQHSDGASLPLAAVSWNPRESQPEWDVGELQIVLCPPSAEPPMSRTRAAGNPTRGDPPWCWDSPCGFAALLKHDCFPMGIFTASTGFLCAHLEGRDLYFFLSLLLNILVQVKHQYKYYKTNFLKIVARY